MELSSCLKVFTYHFLRILQFSPHQEEPGSPQETLANRVSELWGTPEPLTPTIPGWLGEEDQISVFFSQSPSPQLFSCTPSPNPTQSTPFSLRKVRCIRESPER